jgi:hypothetical protein
MRARCLSAIFVLAISAMPMLAANVSGKWLLTRQPAGGRGNPPVAVTFNQVGSELTGSLAMPPGNSTGSPANLDVLDGKVEGDAVSFYLWTGFDRPVKNFYQGKITGEDIVFTVTIDSAAPGGAGAPRSFQVVAKRVR